MTLSDKVKENQFIVVDQIALTEPKTKELVKVFTDLHKGIKTLGKKQMLITPKKDDKLARSSRNLKSITSVLANSLNLLSAKS